MSEENKPEQNGQNPAIDTLPYRFIINLLDEAGKSLDKQQAAQLIRGCSSAHYSMLDVDSMVSGYAGHLEDFIEFIERKWGWKIRYDAENSVIEADENKPFCVCPLVRNGAVQNPLLCHCSEGFSQRMFSKVIGKPVRCEVVSSVLRGGSSCVYRISIED